MCKTILIKESISTGTQKNFNHTKIFTGIKYSNIQNQIHKEVINEENNYNNIRFMPFTFAY